MIVDGIVLGLVIIALGELLALPWLNVAGHNMPPISPYQRPTVYGHIVAAI
jgi:hypothetical protein